MKRIRKGVFAGLSFNVIILGIISLLMDMSSEMIMPILPLFLITLGAGPLIIGLIEGLADSTASILKVVSGFCSDRLGRRKPFVSAGYSASTIAKVILPLALSWPHVLLARFFDRVGKGVRDAPRDAIIATSSEKGKAFGFHRAMDTTGAVVGPLLVLLLFAALWYRGVFWVAIIPAAVAAVLTWAIREIPSKARPTAGSLSKDLRLFLVIIAVFSLGNFSYAFFVLRASELFGAPLADMSAEMLAGTVGPVVAIYLLFNVVYALFAMPLGMLSDRIGRRPLIMAGYILFGGTCFGFAWASVWYHAVLLFVAYGIALAINETVQRAFVADFAPAEVRGTALGAYHTVVGLCALPSSLIAGWLWQTISPQVMYLYGGGMAVVACIAFAIAFRGRQEKI